MNRHAHLIASRSTMTKSLKLTLLAMATAVAIPTAAVVRNAHAGDKAARPGDAARADIQKTLGFVPQFFLKFPDAALPGAWEEMKTLQMNPKTAL